MVINLFCDASIDLDKKIACGGCYIIRQENNGEIYVAGNYIDTLDMANFEDMTSLTKQGDNLYTSTGQRSEFTGSILQNFLEVSNVNTVSAMVDMITVARTYEMNQKMIQTQDNLLGKAVNDLGRV